MKGYILLEGGAEFGGGMAEPDSRAIELAGGFDGEVSIVPAAAAPDNNHERAGQNGVSWFKELGAKRVTLLPLIDHASANQNQIVTSLLNSRLIYLLGGFPLYLKNTLEGSLGWQSIVKAYREGSVVGGSSAGAMVLGEHFYDPETRGIVTGLTLIPRICIIPHHDASGRRWASHLSQAVPGDIIVGIDEQTGIIDDGADGTWNVYGKGSVTLYRNGAAEIYRRGETFSL
ncbi:MAG TPA: Type 1 glutamine amidotransferase-like domain-containing protein [Thermodesulfovibrionales bacterium]|nr:Type 1 glutamine amidotransferase-like domain-containing protein [Thermodesulfovibrionales bacterium]